MKVADQQNFATGISYLVFGIAVAFAASRYRVGSLVRIGPGFFPFAAGVALGIVGACMMILTLRSAAPNSKIGPSSGQSVIVVLSSVVLFGLLLERMGLLVAVPVLVGLSARAHPNFSWRSLGVSVLLLLVLTWAIFVVLLGLPFRVVPPFLTR